MHIITGQLRKPTYIKPGVGKDGQSTMYGLELSEVIVDYKTGEKSWTLTIRRYYLHRHQSMLNIIIER